MWNNVEYSQCGILWNIVEYQSNLNELKSNVEYCGILQLWNIVEYSETFNLIELCIKHSFGPKKFISTHKSLQSLMGTYGA